MSKPQKIFAPFHFEEPSAEQLIEFKASNPKAIQFYTPNKWQIKEADGFIGQLKPKPDYHNFSIHLQRQTQLVIKYIVKSSIGISSKLRQYLCFISKNLKASKQSAYEYFCTSSNDQRILLRVSPDVQIDSLAELMIIKLQARTVLLAEKQRLLQYLSLRKLNSKQNISDLIAFGQDFLKNIHENSSNRSLKI